MRKQLTTFVALLLFVNVATAQTSESRHAIGLSATGNDYVAPIPQDLLMSQPKGFRKWFDFNNKTFGMEYFYARYLNKSFNLKLPIGVSSINLPFGNYKNKKDTEFRDGFVQTYLDLHAVYKLNNDYIFKENSYIAPYLYAGVGGQYVNHRYKMYSDTYQKFDFQVPFGLGIGFRLAEGVYLNTQAEYRSSFTRHYDLFQLKGGLAFTFGKASDRDGDGISDKKDMCPDEAGLAALNGCPDRDGDGVTDKQDVCPDAKGTAAFNGCPDTDGDGIVDKDDACPNEKGSEAMKGCPDRDSDGIADANDSCPDKAGTAALNGCPDTDGDGIADKNDTCPNEKGTAALKGCPDSDGDGLADKDDACPNEFGVIAERGCPAKIVVTDRDSDGIADKDDLCPDQKGTAALKGCPDTDGDGVADKDDNCPALKGTKENKGCPVIEKKDEERLNFAMSAVQFETGKAILKTESYSVLDEVVTILKKYEGYRVVVEGHTDDQGADDKNLTLSSKRAAACADYLRNKGIGGDRVFSQGFGESQPIGDNKTEEGRKRNRRVEFKLSPK